MQTVSNKYTLKDHKGPRKRPPPLKLPTISAVKLERKQEKKRLRKVNKAEKKGLGKLTATGSFLQAECLSVS